MLSRNERRQLREIEKSVELADPAFAALLSGPPSHRLAAAVALAGVLTALFGLLLSSSVFMLGGACLALNGFLRVLVARWADQEPS